MQLVRANYLLSTFYSVLFQKSVLMKMLLFLAVPLLMVSCMLFYGRSGSTSDFENGTCSISVTDAEAEQMKAQIDAEAFSDDQLFIARSLAKDKCFTAQQVVVVMSAFKFEDGRLEIAKNLYGNTLNKNEYELCVDALTFSSSKDELRAYIQSLN